MRIKTSELSGAALDWVVAKLRGVDYFGPAYKFLNGEPHFNYSTDWGLGGPIIEQEKIGLDYYPDGGHRDGGEWSALRDGGNHQSFGPTPLIAAMRCYVASKLGDEVDVPKELA